MIDKNVKEELMLRISDIRCNVSNAKKEIDLAEHCLYGVLQELNNLKEK